MVLTIDITGFGAVGRELARKIAADEDLRKSFVVTSIMDSSGTVYPKSQQDVMKAVEFKSLGKKLDSSGIEKKSGKPGQIAVDVTTSDYKKPEVAKGRASEALNSGKHFVTANKVALAYYFSEIFDIARKKRLSIGYRATICGGIHAISVAKRITPGEIQSASAVLNASTTMILSMLEENESLTLEEASKKAAETGVLEKDWSIDLDGIDAGAKTSILANVIFPESSYSLADVAIRGLHDQAAQTAIKHIAQKKKESGEKIRLVSEITRDSITVEPRSVVADSPLAVPGRYNVVNFKTKTLGEISVRNFGGGVELTASVLIADLKSLERLTAKKS
jgi:homoserine dehydrogenase